MAAHKLTESANGVYIISATPFAEDGTIDYASADRLVEFYIEKQVTGITILGMMGEAPKLSGEESTAFLRHMLTRVNGRVPVIAGVSGAGLDNMKILANRSMDGGAAGVMVAPSGGQNTEQKLYNYFAQICEALGEDTPLVYQDFPLSTGVHISVPLFNRLVADMPQIVMLKHEDWPGLNKLSAIRAASDAGEVRRVSILTGNGGIFLPQELARGADGAMTGFAFPEMLVQVVELHRQGKLDEAEDVFEMYLPLVRHEQQPGFGLAVRKEVLRRRGIIANAGTRQPGPSLTSADHEELTRMLDRLEQRLEAAHG